MRHSISVHLPMPFGMNTRWDYVFNSDSNTIYHDFETFEDPIVVYTCQSFAEQGLESNVMARESWCADVHFGSFAVKILRASFSDDRA